MTRLDTFVFAVVACLALLPLAAAETLQVTEEHPFLLNGSWVEAKELKTGDVLTTADGGQVRIKSVTRVQTSRPFPVYNLEARVYHDFVAGMLKVVVHNSEAPNPSTEGLEKAGTLKKFGDGFLDPNAVRMWEGRPVFAEEYEMLEWSSNYPHSLVVQTGGNFKRVFIVDGSIVKELPERLAKEASEIVPEGMPVVIKILKYWESGPIPSFMSEHYDIREEAMLMDEMNFRFGKTFFPKSKIVVYNKGEIFEEAYFESVRPRGIMMQEAISDPPVYKFNSQLNQFLTPDVNAVRRGRALEIFDLVNGEIELTVRELSAVFKDTRMSWTDASPANLAVGLRYYDGAEYVPIAVSDFINSDMDTNKLLVVVRGFEAGGMKTLDVDEEVVIGYQRAGAGSVAGVSSPPRLELPESAKTGAGIAAP